MEKYIVMKRTKTLIAASMLTLAGVNMANAQSLSDILGKLGNMTGNKENTEQSTGSGSGLGGTLGNILEGVFSSSNLSVADLAGTWKSSRPAVSFQGDNFLKKAGGVAAAAAIESKLEPYFNQYGLKGAVLTVDNAGKFTLAVKNIKLQGTVTETGEKGVFNFNFQAFGKIKLGAVKTYVQKTSSSMDVMFDATKMMSLVSTVAKVTNVSTLNALSSILNSYDGLCVGFKMSK
ncbi:MAG: DUF4923 family protein [Muribaculaceae bacterium]|nr:DUF4923 family protein [Muribaculaceae bacterium]